MRRQIKGLSFSMDAIRAQDEVPTTEVISTHIGVMTYLAPKASLASSEAIGELRDAVDLCIIKGEVQVVINLCSVEYVNSEALETLLDMHTQLVRLGGWLKLAQVNNLAREIFYITGINEVISIIDIASDNNEKFKKPDRNSPRQKLGDILVENNMVSQKKLDEVISLQLKSGNRLGQILVEKGIVSERDMMLALAEQLAMPYVNLRAGLYDPDVVKTLDKEVATRLGSVPIFKIKDKLLVATSDPQALHALNEIEEHTGSRVSPVLALQEHIIKSLNEVASDNPLTSDLIFDVKDDFEVVDSSLTSDQITIDELAAGSPIINMVNSIIQRAINDKASDIHIEPGRSKTLIRFRIDGLLYEVMTVKPVLHPAVISRLKVMANLDISERRLPQDGRIQVYTHGREVDLRFSSLPGLHGEKIVLRVLDKNQTILDVNKLGMSVANLALYLKMLKRTHGLILVTGPTGSGKTTSLYAALNYINSIEKNIVTIEDPVEYQMEIINQNEIKASVGLTFAKILKHVLRQDPDIVMVGEIREQETAEIAVQAALTGHLVLSTLHTNDSAGAITRMIDMGIEPYLLSSALVGVLAQRLIRTICPACNNTFIAPPEMVERYGWETGKQIRLARGRGCPECYDSGYKGRASIHELLEVDQELQKLIMANPSRDVLSEFIARRDIKTLYDDGLVHVHDGDTTIEEITRVINN